jgi:hypothetical protein
VSDEHADALRMLDERRNNLSASRTRTVNQLHTLIGQLHLKGAIIEIEPARYQLSTADLRRCWIPRRALVAATSNTGATLRNGLGWVPRMDIDITCPHCNRLDLAQSVPAVHAEGVSTNSGPTPTPVWGVASTGLVPVIGTATAGSRAHQCARPEPCV